MPGVDIVDTGTGEGFTLPAQVHDPADDGLHDGGAEKAAHIGHTGRHAGEQGWIHFLAASPGEAESCGRQAQEGKKQVRQRDGHRDAGEQDQPDGDVEVRDGDHDGFAFAQAVGEAANEQATDRKAAEPKGKVIGRY